MRLGFRTSDARGGYLFQLKVYKALCILRLFRVSAVDAVSYEMRRIEKPLRLNCGTITSRGTSRQHKYSIAQGDVAHLRRFWKRVSPVLPQVVFEPSAEEADCVSIAYHRYCNAVLQGGLWERRVATAVMGLEALFLEGDGELKYRLGLRVARVLGLLGLDPHKVTKELRDAYDVRSKYVHGSALSKAKKKTIGAGCDGQNVFTLNVFNYLRLSILVWLVISPGNKKPLSKRELLQLIDRSMVDSSQARVLEEHLRPVAEIIGGWQ